MNGLRDKNGLTEDEFLKAYNSDKYPKPALTADICIIAGNGNDYEILLIKRGGHPYLGRWALPGGFADENEPLEETAKRELFEETHIKDVALTLTGVYSAPGRDPRGWTVSAAFSAVIEKSSVSAQAGDDAADAKWFKITDKNGLLYLSRDDIMLPVSVKADQNTPGLAFDHDRIISDALKTMIYK